MPGGRLSGQRGQVQWTSTGVLTPALAARLIKAEVPDRRGWLARIGRTVEGGFHRLERGYGWLLGKSLRWRFVVVIVALAILGSHVDVRCQIADTPNHRDGIIQHLLPPLVDVFT